MIGHILTLIEIVYYVYQIYNQHTKVCDRLK